MTIEQWIREKEKIIGKERMSAGSRILVSWWELSADRPELREQMERSANEVLEKWPQ
mgnify:CR=1 FL=1